MALTAIDYALWRAIAENKAVPPQPDVLELGEANWYGDVDLGQLLADIPRFADEGCIGELVGAVNQLRSSRQETSLFDLAKVFYKTFLNYRTITAIDLDGTSQALRYDLNEPVPLEQRYHVVINTGTAEHVFNQYQFFRTVHERTHPGGLMAHAFPFGGWLDHGFYNYNPTFVLDLAARNDYRIVVWVYGELSPFRMVQLFNAEQVHDMARKGELGANSLHYVTLQKPSEDRPFAMPMQGYYAQTLSPEARANWASLR